MIDKDSGRLTNPTVLQSSDPRLNELALAAVQEWRWRPGTMNGTPVDVSFVVDVKFHTP